MKTLDTCHPILVILIVFFLQLSLLSIGKMSMSKYVNIPKANTYSFGTSQKLSRYARIPSMSRYTCVSCQTTCRSQQTIFFGIWLSLYAATASLLLEHPVYNNKSKNRSRIIYNFIIFGNRWIFRFVKYCFFFFSESSMFVSKRRFILKTCGTTTPLLCLEPLLLMAEQYAGFTEVEDLYYSRKNFKRPDLQVMPHQHFDQEVRLVF